jgi:anaerobic sulfite reductase subunit B
MTAGTMTGASAVDWSAVPDVARSFRVAAKRAETSDVVTLRVEPMHGHLPSFRPAQFSMIGVLGVGEVPISISSRSDDRRGHEYTLRRAGVVTNALADVAVGDVITVRGPFGVPWNLDRCRSRHALFIAGGIGLAPLRAAIEEVAAMPRPDRPRITVLVGARDPANVLSGQWLSELVERGVDVVVTVDGLGDGDAEGRDWNGPTGLVTDLIAATIESPALVEAYVCGPDVMMHATIAELRACGVQSGQVEVTLERNMQCANGWCGHCQLGPLLVCRDGPVVRADRLGDLLARSEL